MSDKAKKQIGTLLRLRRQREELAIQAFTRGKAQMQSIQADIVAMEEMLAKHNGIAREALLSNDHGLMNSAAMGQYRMATADLCAAIAERRARLIEAQEMLVGLRQELMAAMKQRKAVGQLSDNLRGRAARNRLLNEVKEWDDQHAAYRAGRKNAVNE